MVEQEVTGEAQTTPERKILHALSLVLTIGGALITILLLVLWQIGFAALLDIVGTTTIVFCGVLTYILTRRGRLLLAGGVVVVLLLVITTYFVLAEGPKLTAVLLLAGAVVFADFLVGGSSGPIVAAVAALSYLAAGMAHELGWIQISYQSSFAEDAVTVVLVLGGLAYVARTFTKEARSALQRAQAREIALRAADKERSELLEELQAREIAQRRLLETVRELGSPIIPLAKDVIAMPLIGTMDQERVQHVTAALLEGVAEHRARVVIVDITGVPVVDTALAGALLKAAQGVRLLGAEPILTGLRAEVAQTIVAFGLDLSGIITRATLQEGLDYALAQPRQALLERG